MKDVFLSDLSEEEREIVEYGITQGMVLLIGLVVAIVMGILLKIPGKAIIFLACSYFLRIYAGGYHAKTQSQCTIFSAVATFLCFLWLKYLIMPMPVLHILSLATGVFVFRFAPIDNENKELDEVEKRFYAKKTQIIVLIEAIAYIICGLLKWNSVCYCINLSLIFVAMLMLMEMVSKRMKGELR